MNSQHIHDFKNEIEYAEDGIVSKQILKHKNGNVTLFAFDKSQELSAHTSPFEALVSVLEGEVIIQIDGDSSKLKEGESIILPSGIPHGVKAVTKFKMLLTMIRPDEK